MSLRNVALALLLAAASALSLSCSAPPGASASGTAWKATLTWSPGVIAPLGPTALRLRLIDHQGNALDAEDLQAEAVMASMSHAREAVTFRSAGLGEYEATHSFSMDGRWELRLRGGLNGGSFIATFQVPVGSF